MSKKVEFTIGADPEVFIFNSKEKKYIPSFELFQGSKDNPTKFGKDGFAVLCDNAMVEFNIPPANNYDDFYGNLVTALEYIQSRLPEDHIIAIEEKADFDSEYLENPNMQEFGCAEQYNIYNIQGENCQMIPPHLRFAGGHIHIGIEDTFNFGRLIRCLDLFVGLEFFDFNDEEISRKKFYGMPGNFRETSYGIEYRTPSNIWLTSEENVKKLYTGVEKAITIASDDSIDILSDEDILLCYNSEEHFEKITNNYLITA